MLQRALCVLACVSVIVAGLASAALADISYSQTFQSTTPNPLATDNGPLGNYPGWTYTELNSDAYAQARVDTIGTLVLDHQTNGYNSLTAKISAMQLSGQSTFDVSTNPLTVSVNMGATGSRAAGWTDAILTIGPMAFEIFPGLNADGHGMERVTNTYGAYLPNSIDAYDLPTTTTLDGTKYNLSVTITKTGTVWNTALYNFAISSGGTYLRTVQAAGWVFEVSPGGVPATAPLDSISLAMETTDDGTGYFSNLTVVQGVPEPGTLMLLATGLIGLLAYAWRKRK